MFSTVLGFALLLVLAVAVLPVSRVRRWLLTVTARLGRAVVLAFLGACGTFFVNPQAAPAWLTNAVQPLLEATLGLPLNAATGLPWLVLAVLAVGISLPVLLFTELGLSLSGQTAQVQALRQEIRQAATWVDSRLALLGVTGATWPALPSEAAAAAEALHAAGNPDLHTAAPAVPLVLDLLK